MTDNPFAALLRDVPRYRPEPPGVMVPDPIGVWVDHRHILAALARAMGPDDLVAEAQEMVRRLLNEHDAFSGHAADLIAALLARIAAQEAQIKGQSKMMAAWRDDLTEMRTALAAMTKERDELAAADRVHASANAGMKHRLETALAAERARVAKLVEAGKRALEPLDEPCRRDHHGYCQAHFLEADCSVAALRAAITEAGQ